jgi:hypothetical protein
LSVRILAQRLLLSLIPLLNPPLSRPLSEADEGILSAFTPADSPPSISPNGLFRATSKRRLLAGFVDGRVTLEQVSSSDIEDVIISLTTKNSPTGKGDRLRILPFGAKTGTSPRELPDVRSARA